MNLCEYVVNESYIVYDARSRLYIGEKVDNRLHDMWHHMRKSLVMASYAKIMCDKPHKVSRSPPVCLGLSDVGFILLCHSCWASYHSKTTSTNIKTTNIK